MVHFGTGRGAKKLQTLLSGLKGRCGLYAAYPEVGLSTACHPSHHDIRAWHLPIGRQSKAYPSCSAHIHCKVNGLCAPGEVPMQSIVLATLIKQNCTERVLGLQIHMGSCTEANGPTDQQWNSYLHA